ncbi:hypothetical protein Tco_0986837 [Tanacetum coccineum]
MPPRRLKKKSIKRLVEKRVAKAIEEYEKSRANLDSSGSSGGNPGNAGGKSKEISLLKKSCKSLHDAINNGPRNCVETRLSGRATRVGEYALKGMLGHQEKDVGFRFPDAGGNALQNMTCFGCREKGHYKKPVS